LSSPSYSYQADEHGLPKLYLGLFILMTAFLGWCLVKIKALLDETHKVHLVIKLLMLAYTLQVS
jgi:hypothetical protein